MKIKFDRSVAMNSQDLVEILSKKIGGFSIYLGLMLFVNLYFFFRGRKASKKTKSIQV